MFVDFNILNQLGSPSINSNTFANRPAAGQTGRLFVSTDTYEIYRDNGTTWDLIGGPGSSTVTGTGAATQVAYWTAAQAIGGSNNLWWDNTNGFLGVGTAAPTTRIEAVKTDGIGIYANFTTNAGSGSSTTAIWAKNVTNSSGFAAVIEETTPNATAGQYPLLIKHSLSSGTAGVGMGTGVHWQLPDDAGTFKTTQLTIETIDAAAATYKTRYRFNVQNNGSSTPVAYINSTGVGVFTATPSAALDIHSTGVIAVLNSTGSTNNGYLAFQRAGAGVWRIGDTYNGGNNFFELHNTVLGTDALEFEAATNKSTFQAQQTYTTGLARGNYFDFNLSVAAGGSFSSPNAITALTATLDLTLAGNATIPSGARSGLDAYNSISFTGTGTLTHNQGTQIRAYSNVTAGWAFGGSATGTITHLAGLRALFPDNTGSAIAVTNNYALLLNDQTANTGTVTYTNRWGVYQEGASDLNYMAANLLLGTTVNSGEKLVISGNVYATGTVSIGATSLASTLKLYAVQASGEGNPTLDGSEVAAFQRNFVSAQSASVAIVSGTASTSSLYFGDKDSISIGRLTYDNSSNAMIFNTNAAERMRITSAGLVGIATSAPATSLQVGANSGTRQNSAIGVYNTTVPAFLANADNSSGSVANFSVNSYSTSAGGADTWSTRVNASYGVASVDLISQTSSNSFIRFTTSSASATPTEKMRITSAGVLQVGTTASVNLNAGSVLANSAVVTQGFLPSHQTSVGVLEYNANKTSIRSYGATAGTGFLTFNVGGGGGSADAEAARIATNGNFLIGTTTDAGQKLQVNGNARFTDTIQTIDNTVSNGYLTMGSASGAAMLPYFECKSEASSIAAYFGISRASNQSAITGYSDSAFLITTDFTATTGNLFRVDNNGSVRMRLSNGGKLLLEDSIQTGAPTGGTSAEWKLGSRVAATVVLDTTQYIELQVGATTYKLAIVT